MTVIEILFDGEHSQFAALKDQFTEETAELVEQAMEELIRCNDRMKSLVMGLALKPGSIGLTRCCAAWYVAQHR